MRISLVIGILAFAFLVYQMGPLEIWRNIKKISIWNFILLMGLRLLYWILRTINWKVIMEQYGKNISLWELFLARMCSHTVSQLFPSAQVGGEAARIYMVNTSNPKICVASVIVDKTVEFLSVLVFTLFAVGYIFLRVPMPPKWKYLFMTFEVGFMVLVVLILVKQKKGLITWFVDMLAKIRIRPKFIERNKEKIKETDQYISTFYTTHRKAFLGVFLLYCLLIMVWVVEVHLTMMFMGATNVTIGDSFLITVLGNLSFMFPFIPGMLGVYEATYIAVFALLKLDTPVAFALVLMRRIIALLWAGLGLFTMAKSFPGRPGSGKPRPKMHKEDNPDDINDSRLSHQQIDTNIQPVENCCNQNTPV